MRTTTSSLEAQLPSTPNHPICPECAQPMYRCAVTAITSNPVSLIGNEDAFTAFVDIVSRNDEDPGWLNVAAMCDCGWMDNWHDVRVMFDAAG
jgi:hypothetical protein